MGTLTMNAVLAAFAAKRVLVTGHTGFKGSWLTFLLKELGADVMGIALPPESAASHFTALSLAERIRHVECDVRDEHAVRDAVVNFRPEYVFHMAAQPLVRLSYADPAGTFSTNVMGGVNLLEAVRRCDSVRSLVFVTSDKCYENVEWVWGYRETDRLGGYDPYSASKAAAEIMFSAYSRSFLRELPELGAATARAGNVIGGGDWAADRVVPDCIRAIQAGQPILLRSPDATRPWQHVLEPLSGYLMLAVHLFENPREFEGAWNFGPATHKVRTVHDVATAIVSHMHKGHIEIGAPGNRHEAGLLQLNCDKAHQLLGWRPRWDVDQTLAATAEWYAEVLGGVSAETMTRKQINEYFRELS